MYDAQLFITGNDLILKLFSNIDIKAVRHILQYDEKFKSYRTYPMNYGIIVNHISPRYTIDDKIHALVNEELTFSLDEKFELRDYQKESVNEWIKNDYRGIIVLPTGTGKTFVAMYSISLLRLKTLIVVPTINLLEQWKRMLENHLGVDIGVFGGGQNEKKEITVATYDSAYLHFSDLLDFGFVIFDEVHHLPSKMYRRVAQALPAYRRLGITATPERSDNLHEDLKELIGKEVYRASPADLKEHIAQFQIRKIFIELNEEQAKKYEEARAIYRGYCLKKHISMFSPQNFQRLIFLSFHDHEARKALRAHRESRQIAFNSESKLVKLEEILIQHRKDKVIIFSEFNSIVMTITRKFFIPCITHKTKTKEREQILNAFRDGTFTKIVTSKVLDEGWDVKDANIGIVISGSSIKRQLIQRLGRLLRKKDSDGEVAMLYELISKGTMEADTSRRRAL